MTDLPLPYSSVPVTPAQANEGYDPAHPEFDDDSTMSPMPRQEREFSPASAVIARVTGEWGSSAVEPLMAMDMGMVGGQQPAFTNGFYNTQFTGPGRGGGVNMGETFAVAPHINPRFAATIGGISGFNGTTNFHPLAHQHQLFYQQAPQIQTQQQGAFDGHAVWGSAGATRRRGRRPSRR